MASAASRFVPLESSLDEFIEGQANKNTVSKTKQGRLIAQVSQ